MLNDALLRIIANPLNQNMLVVLVLLVIPIEAVVVQNVSKRLQIASQLGLVLLSDVLEHLLLGFLNGIELLIDFHQSKRHEH